MSDELIEALGKRLVKLAMHRGLVEDDEGIHQVPAPPWYEVMAAECLRQMEYARRCVGISGPTTIETTELRFGEIVPVTKIIAPAELHFSDLALAPEDWKP